MSETIQWLVVGIIVAAAVIYLVKHLRPSKSGCCEGCPRAGSCGTAKDNPNECPEPKQKEK